MTGKYLRQRLSRVVGYEAAVVERPLYVGSWHF